MPVSITSPTALIHAPRAWKTTPFGNPVVPDV